MNKQKMVVLLALIVSLAGLFVSLGWILDVDFLKSILPNWVTMKFMTAICFVLSGLEILFIKKMLINDDDDDDDFALINLMVIPFVILIIMSSILSSALFGLDLAVERMFILETGQPIYTISPGQPSLITIISFILVAASGFLIAHDRKNVYFLKIFGRIIIFFSLLAILGYLINIPLMYFFVPGVSSAMALHSAVLFCFLGVSLRLLSMFNKK